MHYQKFTIEELYKALDAAQTFYALVDAPLNAATHWDFLCNLEAEIEAMQTEITRRVMPAERIFIQVEVA